MFIMSSSLIQDCKLRDYILFTSNVLLGSPDILRLAHLLTQPSSSEHLHVPGIATDARSKAGNKTECLLLWSLHSSGRNR